ncbi:hypothetical protein LZ480_18985 [Solibacillus sp. MA9]|uniref:Uncharacterized protein n=1 Tax=Solibacillus palustris TaxID=2908203 RepID=A0ABS9UHZ1_9BACL|nr:hypothetical protein [Solibacillus sp. MA9]MCH7323951.1 hypothetical protein [Solibacillus sp. MA9]
MNYLKERNKMIVLLVVGVVILIGVLYLLSSTGNGVFLASYSGIFIIFALVLYPLALVYGRSQMVDIFHSIRIGARQPFLTKKANSPWKVLTAALNTVIALLTIIFFGWIYGAYTAYQKLQMLKSYHVK